jgi:hypothetical protein
MLKSNNQEVLNLNQISKCIAGSGITNNGLWETYKCNTKYKYNYRIEKS